MPTLTRSALAANLAALGERNADVAEQIRAAVPAAGMEFAETDEGAPTAALDGRPLASRRRPREEAARFADTIDLVENAVVVVLGFGLGYHVETLARRMGRKGLIVVFEPDVTLLRGVLERIDHSPWLRESLVMFVTDPEDRGALGRKLAGAEPYVGQGVALAEHPASRSRLAPLTPRFSAMLAAYVTTVKITLTTTLVRSVATVRNLLANARHYAGGAGIHDLKDAARGRLAVTVSAGPSLRKNIELLARPGVRDRCVIIAVQTALKPLLAAGVRPHFVTALDFHEISRRFYEGVSAEAVEGTTLVTEPKAHPSILASFPGPVRCCASPILDRMLGPLQREMGTLPAGATVAHLAVYLARWLGCHPIAMIGQDLGFPDGLYYAPGTAIHEIWAPELNAFNTIAMMEWQRIVRLRGHLHKTTDVFGKSIYTDAQMRTYLQQFESDFAKFREDGIDIIDATEGGVAKQHTRAASLEDVLAEHAVRRVPELPAPPETMDQERLAAALKRLGQVQREIAALRETSKRTATVLRRMLEVQDDAAEMARLFQKIERYRAKVEARFDSFELLGFLNQLGSFKRLRADRRLDLQRDLDPRARQRAQLERDLENVVWLADAAEEMIDQLADGQRSLRNEPILARSRVKPGAESDDTRVSVLTPARVAALVPVDPERNGLGITRSLAEDFGGRSVLQATLEGLDRSEHLERIVLLVPDGFDVDRFVDRAAITRPVEIERCEGGPFGPERDAIAAARRWAETCWRGAPGGASIWDEALGAPRMAAAMKRLGVDAGLVAAPDWPLIAARGETGVDALVDRFREQPEQHTVVFNQAPPGLAGCLVSARLMNELARGVVATTIGGVLAYRPQMPQEDPIGKDANVQIDHVVRNALVRATFDSPRQHALVRAALANRDPATLTPAEIVTALERASAAAVRLAPRHVTLELTTERRSRGLLARHPGGPGRRPPLSLELARRIFEPLGATGDVVVTLGGAGDPLLHDAFDTIVSLARAAGVAGVNVRTELLAGHDVLDRLLACSPDVVSVDLHADCAATYERMMGLDEFHRVLDNMQHLLSGRRRLAGGGGGSMLALPWIAPHLQRRAETYEDIDTFFDRWQHMLGAAVIESPPPAPRGPDHADAWPADTLAEAVTPPAVVQHELTRGMTVLSDGSVPVSGRDLAADIVAGRVDERPLLEIWGELLDRRRAAEPTT